MKGGYIFGIGLIVIAVLIISFATSGEVTESEVGVVVEKSNSNEVPEFLLKDHDGNIVETKDFKRQILVVNSWATWCPFCVKELSEFAELEKEFGEIVTVIAINRAEPLSVADEFVKDIGLSEEILFLIDENDSFYKSIGGFSMPETIFVDAKGKIVQHKRGPLDFIQAKSIINEILAEK